MYEQYFGYFIGLFEEKSGGISGKIEENERNRFRILRENEKWVRIRGLFGWLVKGFIEKGLCVIFSRVKRFKYYREFGKRGLDREVKKLCVGVKRGGVLELVVN